MYLKDSSLLNVIEQLPSVGFGEIRNSVDFIFFNESILVKLPTALDGVFRVFKVADGAAFVYRTFALS